MTKYQDLKHIEPLAVTSQSVGSSSKSNMKTRRKPSSFCSMLNHDMKLLLFLVTVCLTTAINAIRLQPESLEKHHWVGDSFVITCQNNHNIKNVKMRWTGPDGREIVEDRSLRVHTESATPHGHRLIVMNATYLADTGTYKCTLGGEGDRHPKESIEFTLHVHKTIDFDDTASRYTLQIGERAQLSCRVRLDENAQATVSWLRDRRPIESFDDSSITSKDYNEQTQSSVLTIKPVGRHHDATYTCRVLAMAGDLSQIREHDIRLDVQYAPTFDTPTRTVWIASGAQSLGTINHRGGGGGANGQVSMANNQQQQRRKELALRCVSYANPAPRLEWTNARTGQVLARGQPSNVLDITDGFSSLSSSQQQQQQQRQQHQQQQLNESTSGYNNSNNNHIASHQRGQRKLVQRTQLDNRTVSTLRLAEPQHQGDQQQLDSYTCTAQNALGTAQKTFTLATGAVPPAYKARVSHYEQSNAQLELTVYGPTSSHHTAASHGEHAQMHATALATPPVDAFRVRIADAPVVSPSTLSSAPGTQSAAQAAQTSTSQASGTGAFVTFSAHLVSAVGNATTATLNERRQSLSQRPIPMASHGLNAQIISGKNNNNGNNGPVAQQLARYHAALGLNRSPSMGGMVAHRHRQSIDTDDVDYDDELAAVGGGAHDEPKWPVNYTLSLASLPAGQHRLYLDAHNAVGWSTNGTLLGEYYIVSGASVSAASSPTAIAIVGLWLTVAMLFASTHWDHNFIIMT